MVQCLMQRRLEPADRMSSGSCKEKGVNILAKALYSLMLSEEVVREVDALAHRRGTNRSAQVNAILAEYLSVRTPESCADDILKCACELAGAYRDLVALYNPNQATMALKSMLTYKYRPTLKYEICLSNKGRGATMAAVYRTRSEELDMAVRSFAAAWARAERRVLPSLNLPCPQYRISPGRIERTLDGIDIDRNSPRQSAGLIVEFVNCFDKALKLYIDGGGDIVVEEICRNFFSQAADS